MKFFIQKNKTAFNSVFNIYNELGKEEFFAELDQDKKARNILIKNADGFVAAKIKRLVIGSVVIFKIKTKNKTVYLILGQNRGSIACICYGLSWEIMGNFAEKSFSFIDVDNSVIATHKNVFIGRSEYELNVIKQNTELLCIAISICINSFNLLDNTVTLAV